MVSEATKKPQTKGIYSPLDDLPLDLSREYCHLLRRRRSAQAMDGKTYLPLESFHSILKAALPTRAKPSLPWRPYVHPVFFVHRVVDMDRGLYILLRDRSAKEDLVEAMDPEFLWEKPSRTPLGLELYQILQGDGRLAAKQSSCRQDIASDGCFAVAMIAHFEEPLREYGPWFYSRLYWECGVIGQALYLASEEAGFRGCGIGCFFDDMVHHMLGLSGMRYQDLYHFTVGKPLTDPRLIDLPPYS